MKRFNLGPLARDIDVGILVENFLISAVATIIIVRVLLALTGYPQLGNGNLHIAHMLWGGFLMMAAIILLLTFLSKEIKYVSAIIGGIGFGAFIDELGKFITSDNNYFFEPTIAFIYIIFVILYLLARVLENRIVLTDKEYLVNSIEYLKEAVMHDLDDEEKQRALKMLQNIKHDGTTVASIKKILQDTVPAHSHQIGSFTKIKNFFEEIYHKLTNKPWFAKRLILFFSIISIVNLVESIINISTTSGFFEWGELITSGASGIIVVIGIYWMRINRIVTYKIFKIAVMISIFLTQFFRFYQQQLVAVVGLMISIFIVGSLQYLILQESTRTNKSVIKK